MSSAGCGTAGSVLDKHCRYEKLWLGTMLTYVQAWLVYQAVQLTSTLEANGSGLE